MPHEKTCLNPACGKTFLAKRSDKKCCSTSCYTHYYYLAHTEKILAYHHAYYIENRESELASSLAYAAAHREEMLANYYRRMEENPENVRATRRNSGRKCRKERPEEFREKAAAYRAANREQYQLTEARRRAAKANAAISDLTIAQWKEIKAAFAYRCAYCGTKPHTLTMDHITPLSRGGNHTASNIVPACRSCNSSKHASAPLKPVQPLFLTIAKRKIS